MTDYKDLGLTSNFRSVNSLSGKSLTIKGSDFDLEQDRDIINEAKIGTGVIRTENIGTAEITTALIENAAITNAKIGTASIGTANIGTLSFNEISGGTARLGGTINGNGLLELYDTGGTKISASDNSGFHFYGTNGSEVLRIDKNGLVGRSASTGGTQIIVGNDGLLALQNNGTTTFAQVSTGIVMTTGYPLIWTGNALFLRGSNDGGLVTTQTGKLNLTSTGSSVEMYANNAQFLGGSYVNGTSRVYINNPITIGGVEKSAIVETALGHKALYCTESPEVWFMDFCESKDKIDPLFIETTEPPYHFIKCEDDEYQVWGKRKGFAHKRFEQKTKEEFDNNNNFWLQAKTPLKDITTLPYWEDEIDLSAKLTP